ncbi:ATP-binding protein [Paraburkholderia sp. C35]|uniref:ATP-binding protein n=1 Tax=Paraburkholderia sp. C35 TaxID=2126993 RepID=UPI0023B7935C|nr:ATP-binding protein [Paraburkholderia sp. C35]
MTLWTGGCAFLCAIAWACMSLQLRLATTGFCMLIAIVLLSLLDSFVSSAIFSLCGAGLLNLLFTPPIFSFAIEKRQDYLPLVAFLVTSIAVTSLVRKIRRAEAVQREQARLLNLTHDTVFVHDNNDVIRFWNRAAEDLYGWTGQEAIGKPADSLLKTIYPTDRNELMRELAQNAYWEGELVHTKRDGAQVIVSSRWTLQRDNRGQAVAILETNNDITERKRAEELVQRSQAQYLAEAQRLSHTGSFGWNVTTGDVFWSGEAFRIFEQDVAVAPTIALVRERIHPDDVQIFEGMLASVKTDSDRFDIEHRLLFPDNRVKHLHVVGHAVEAGPGKRQFVGAVMDVTETKATQAKLRHIESELARASRVSALGELSASIAHEVGQPLAAVVTNGEACLRWLRRTPPNFEEVEGCVVQITDEANRAAGIVQRVRRLMKGAPPEMVPIEVADLVQEVVALVRLELERQSCSLTTRIESDVPAVMGDRVQLQQVLINIVINAAQAMSANPGKHQLVIGAVRDDSDHVILSVRDSGPGIREESLPRLFDAFFTTRSDGMGMGLAICASIVEAHGGRIWAANNADGGATFSFSLPACVSSGMSQT